MTTVITIATVLISLGGFLDFLLGEPGNRQIKDRLVAFYISVEEGDWSSLYRVPAGALLRFMENLLGQHILSIQFAVRTIILSIIVTTLMLITYLAIVYLQAVWHQTVNCPAPPLYLALQIPMYVSAVLWEVFLVNAVFDIMTWSATIYGLRIVSATQGKFTALGIVIASIVFSVLILHFLHSVYLPLSLAHSVRSYGITFGAQEYLQFLRNGFLTPLTSIFQIRGFIQVGCFLPPARPFSISMIALTQYAALEALIPLILFVIVSLLGSIAYITRRFTRKPIALITHRLTNSKNVCVTIASLLSGLVAIFKIFAGSASG